MESKENKSEGLESEAVSLAFDKGSVSISEVLQWVTTIVQAKQQSPRQGVKVKSQG